MQIKLSTPKKSCLNGITKSSTRGFAEIYIDSSIRKRQKKLRKVLLIEIGDASIDYSNQKINK